MGCEIIRVAGAVLYARISGVMKLTDQELLQAAGRDLIAHGRQVRLHVTLEGFQGWEKGVDWGDIDFLMGYGNNIARIAIVGDGRWKEQVFAFVGKGLRPTQIEFFDPSSEVAAESWVRG